MDEGLSTAPRFFSQWWPALWRGVVDAIVPPRCLVCREAVSEPASLCLSCWQGLHFIEAPLCQVMGTPFAYDRGAGAVSAAAIADPPVWSRARAAVAYDAGSRVLVHALKYRDTMEAGLLMARLMGRAGAELLHEAPLLVPVPLHRTRLWRRRFNQAAFLAQHIGRAHGVAFRPDLLERRQVTRSQVGLKQEERRQNVRKAFAVPPALVGEVAGRRIVLVDDVMTTGSTASACCQVLLAAGAEQVDVMTFALVLEAKRPHIGRRT
jgi:ComF family protein